MDLGAVLPMTAEVRDDHLFVGGVDMVELAHKEGTALYVMDEADLRNRMETYLTSFRSRYENSDVIYASKAFLNKEAARIAAQEGHVPGRVRRRRAGAARSRRTSPWSACSCTATTKRRRSCARPFPQAWAASWLTAESSWRA